MGSFLNVVIYRLPREESIIFPSSHCPDCETKLTALDLVPVLSFLLTQGRCRYCGAKISYQYPLVELLTALSFWALYSQYQLTLQFFIYICLVSTLIVISLIDLKHFIIPNKITYPGIIAAFTLSFFRPQLSYLDALLGILLPSLFLFLLAVISRGGLGMGDVKLIAMLGGFLGLLDGFLALFLGAMIGSVMGIILMVFSNKGLKSKLPFGLFISLGGLLMILWGQEIINIYWQIISH